MTLIIEDGSGVDGANSFATVAQCQDYCAARGFVLPTPDSAVEVLLVRACDYLQSLNWKGDKADEAFPLVWPRKDVQIGAATTDLPSDAIPQAVILAQCRLAYDFKNTDLMPTGTGREVVMEKIDVIEIQYAERGSGSVVPQPNAALAILTPYLENGGGFFVRSLRV